MFLRFEQIGEIFDLLSLGVIVLSPERKIVSLNHAAESLTGKKANAVIGQNCYEVFLDYLCGGHCKYLEEPEAEIETVVSEIDFIDPNDKQCSLSKIESPIFDADHRLMGCIEVFQDHSAFRDLIKRIRFEDLRLKIILDNLDIGVLTVDRGDHISFFNTMAERITGYSRTELLGKACTKVFGAHFGTDFKKAPELLEDGNGHIRVETDLTTREGQRIPIQASYVPLKNEEGSVVGGLTGSRNRGGMYLRSRAIPTDPASAAQIAVRNLFGVVSAAWSSTLTSAERAAWNLYGSNVPVTDALGDSINLSGQQWYVGANTLRLRAGLSIISDGPTTFSRPSFTSPSSATIEQTDDVGFVYDNTDGWANETGGALLCFAGKPVAPSINFFKGPFRYAGKIVGDDTTPPTSPAALTSPFTQTDGQNVWIRLVAVLADGRFSPSSIIGPSVVTTT